MVSKHPLSAASNKAPGSIPPPQPSSCRRWNGICVELYRVGDVDVVRHDRDHAVVAILRGPVNLYQKRNGRSWQRTMHAGDVIVAPGGEPRAVCHKEEVEAAKVLLAPSLLDTIAERVVPKHRGRIELVDSFGGRDSLIEGLLRRLVTESITDNLGAYLCVESLATELAVHLIRNYSTAAKAETASSCMLPRYKIQRVTDYIRENLREELTLERISATLSMSPYHFAHVFRQSVGVAPHRYLIECRIERAKVLLRDTDLSITEIAHQVGYANQSNFSVVFHRLAGITPRRYRSES